MELAKAHSWQGIERRKGSESRMSLVGTQGQGPGDLSVRVEVYSPGPRHPGTQGSFPPPLDSCTNSQILCTQFWGKGDVRDLAGVCVTRDQVSEPLPAGRKLRLPEPEAQHSGQT